MLEAKPAEERREGEPLQEQRDEDDAKDNSYGVDAVERALGCFEAKREGDGDAAPEATPVEGVLPGNDDSSARTQTPERQQEAVDGGGAGSEQ